MSHKITLIPGDGIGPEISKAVVRIIKASGVEIDWDVQDAGLAALSKFHDPLPQQVIDSVAQNKVALKGPLTTPVGKGFRSVNVALRKEFELFVNQRPAKTFKGIKTLYFDHIDLMIFRENLEEFYSGIEHYIDSSRSAAETIGIITKRGSERIIRYAFEYARTHGRKKVTLVHKANILKYTGGLFLDVGIDVAKDYPDVQFDDKIVDNMAMQMVMNPYQFDVIVTTNLFGDILSDLASGLVGGLGVAPGANIGDGVAIFEAVHGSAPDIAGQNVANPSALLLGAVMMLDYIGEKEAANLIEKSVAKVIENGKEVTRDLNKETFVSTDAMADAIIREMEKG
ncbi:MAG: isocitrate/isopropylmalate dehydrogenase family protein [Ignavibacteriales bacterium]|nr:MAG: isocitrate/isopropylmalate dehydrogenase family protein [Ignavibacteriales bacterium]